MAEGVVAATPEAEQSPLPIHVTLIQLNDIYEITPVSGGRWGGPARVATVRKRLTEENPNTFTILAGDLFSPSALGTARVDGERLAGRQMVAVLNAMGLDYATFGNHEFDLNEEQFLSRMEESAFEWVSTNVTDDEGALFPGVEKHEILTVRDARRQGPSDRVHRPLLRWDQPGLRGLSRSHSDGPGRSGDSPGQRGCHRGHHPPAGGAGYLPGPGGSGVGSDYRAATSMRICGSSGGRISPRS